MEPNGLNGAGGLFSGVGSGLLGLEFPLHQTAANPHQLHHSQSVAYADHHAPASVKYSLPAKAKQNLSDEEDPGGDDGNFDAKKKVSPWQRMKWTDMMVRLLIAAVFYIGDENGSEIADQSGMKKKAVGLLQKKGKWKSVSRAMMEKGFYVSPQQCEDKFNDLNKRYKRVNDILGKGTACRVVENQSLLDSMDLTLKMKEEVRKLLNSKHLFFREMCAYHNSCRHASGSGGHQSPELAVAPQNAGGASQMCVHAPASGEEEEEEEEEDDDSEEEEEEEDEEIEGGSRGQEEEEESERKRARKGGAWPEMQKLRGEIVGVIQDVGKSAWEKKQWMRSKMIQLEEEQVNYQSKGFEMEKQRLKWMKYRSKKEREMERAKLENEKKRLETERMVLLVKQKELDLFDFHHQKQQQQHSSNKRGDPSSVTG